MAAKSVSDFKEIDLDEDSPIEIEKRNEIRQEISLDDHNYDMSLLEDETQEIQMEKIPEIVFISDENVLKLRCDPPSKHNQKTFNFICNHCQKGYMRKYNFDNHCQNLCGGKSTAGKLVFLTRSSYACLFNKEDDDAYNSNYLFIYSEALSRNI